MKTTITIEDLKDGGASINLTFDPPIDANDEKAEQTDAAYLALQAMEFLVKFTKDQENISLSMTGFEG